MGNHLASGLRRSWDGADESTVGVVLGYTRVAVCTMLVLVLGDWLARCVPPYNNTLLTVPNKQLESVLQVEVEFRASPVAPAPSHLPSRPPSTSSVKHGRTNNGCGKQPH